MENNPTRVSRERINENYLRQMLRDDTRGCARGKACERQCAPSARSISACEMSDKPTCRGYESLAMVYSPVQAFGELYDVKTALCRGTIFKELEKPFLAYRR